LAKREGGDTGGGGGDTGGGEAMETDVAEAEAALAVARGEATARLGQLVRITIYYI